MAWYEVSARKIKGKFKIDYVDNISLDEVIKKYFPMTLEEDNKIKAKWLAQDSINSYYNKDIASSLVFEVTKVDM